VIETSAKAGQKLPKTFWNIFDKENGMGRSRDWNSITRN